MTKRLSEGVLYGRMEEFAQKNPNFRKGRINTASFTVSEGIDLTECSISQSRKATEQHGEYGVFAQLLTEYGFVAERRIDNSSSGHYLVFSGHTTRQYVDVTPELYIARAALPESDDPLSELGTVNIEQRFKYRLVSPRPGGIESAQSLTIYNHMYDALLEVHSGRENITKIDADYHTEEAPNYVNDHIAFTTQRTLEQKKLSEPKDEDWLDILRLSASDVMLLVEQIEEEKLRADLRLASFSFNSLRNIIKSQLDS